MSIENEVMQSEGEGIENEGQVQNEVQSQGIGFDFSFLLKPTGEGSIESYLQHPLNFNNSMAVARIIRGATGLLGSLNYALIDIGLGLMDFMKGKGVENASK